VRFMAKKSLIYLKIGSPIPTQGLPIREVRQFEEKVRNLIISQTRSPAGY